MAKALVVVESPAKAKTINKYLGKNYRVVASMGHVRDLPKSKLGVDIEEGFEPSYEVIVSRKKVLKELKDAQQARRVLDRLVGYKISPLLWDKVRRGLSAGRVQSVALKLVCDREREIEAFVPEEYWNITARLAGSVPPEFDARLLKKSGANIKVGSEAEADAILADCRAASWTVGS